MFLFLLKLFLKEIITSLFFVTRQNFPSKGITNVNSRYSLKSNPKFRKTRVQSPSKVIIHECYEDVSGGRFHDIALVKMKRSVEISPTINNVIDDDLHEVQPICLKPTKRAKKVYAAGWGKQRDDVCTTTLNSPRTVCCHIS